MCKKNHIDKDNTMNNKEKIIKCESLLKEMFEKLIHDKKIEKVRFEHLIVDKENFEPNIKEKFFKEYLLQILFIKKQKEDTKEKLEILTLHIMLTSFVFYMATLFNHGDIPLSIATILSIIGNVLFIIFARHCCVDIQAKKEEILKYSREDLLCRFVEGELKLRKYYLENEVFKKEDLIKFISFIKENLSKKEILNILDSNDINNIENANAIYLLLVKIKEKYEKKLLKEQKNQRRKIKEKNINNVIEVLEREEVEKNLFLKNHACL